MKSLVPLTAKNLGVLKPNGTCSKAWRSIRRAATACAIVFCIVAGAIGIYCGVLQLLGNVHVVVEQQFYRSAQLDKVTLARVIQEHGIKSILNLLGASPSEPWYADEIAVSKALGAEHYDYGISANEIVVRDKIDEILKIVRDAPKPILVHCKNGADRSGLVAAVYLAKIQGVIVDEAAGQLSLYYGHFPWLISDTGAMDTSFQIYEQRENFEHHQHHTWR